MRTSRSVLLITIAAAVPLACGGDDSPDAESAASTSVAAATSPTPTAAVTAAPTTTTAAAPTTVVESTATTMASTTTVPAARPRVVRHAMGETEVPAEPQRVVVLDSSFLDASIALGVVPIGATEGTPGKGLPGYLGDALADIEIAGDTTNPNLELVASLEPDLILAAKVRHESIYEQLSTIAPTVFSESSGQNWTDQVRLTGEALGAADAADALISEFEQRAAAVGEAIGADGQTATIVRFLPGETRLYGPTTFSGSVLTSVGFDLGDKGYHPDYGMAMVSAEQIGLMDSDVIFATDYAEEDSERGSIEALWNNLPAVAEGRQFDIDDNTWMTGIGVIGANAILDDLEAWLA